MTPPRTYSEWCAILDALARGGEDAAVVECIAAGEMRWSDGVAQRLADRFGQAFDARFRVASVGFQNALTRARDDAEVSRALTDMRRTFALLNQIATLAVMPAQLGVVLKTTVGNAAIQMNDSLTTSAQSDRTGRLTAAIRRTSLLHFAEGSVDSRSTTEVEIGVRRTRNIMS